MIIPSEDVAKQHYAEHNGKPFYPGLVRFLASGPVVRGIPDLILRFNLQSTDPVDEASKSLFLACSVPA